MPEFSVGKSSLLKYLMSHSAKEELFGLLQAFSPGDIYSIAPKQYVVRGFDYYRQGRLLEFNTYAGSFICNYIQL